MILAINIIGVLLILLIIWWFWMSKPASRKAGTGLIEILVKDGVYTPARIEVKAGVPVSLRFIRKDPSPCAEKVIFDELNISRDLILDEITDITITPDKPGEYDFTCQMQMYRGTLVVTSS